MTWLYCCFLSFISSLFGATAAAVWSFIHELDGVCFHEVCSFHGNFIQSAVAGGKVGYLKSTPTCLLFSFDVFFLNLLVLVMNYLALSFVTPTD